MLHFYCNMHMNQASADTNDEHDEQRHQHFLEHEFMISQLEGLCQRSLHKASHTEQKENETTCGGCERSALCQVTKDLITHPAPHTLRECLCVAAIFVADAHVTTNTHNKIASIHFNHQHSCVVCV